MRERVIEILSSCPSAVPIAVLARELGIPPSRLVGHLDDLYDEGLVTPGRERGTVSLVPQPGGDGRFSHPASGRDGRSARAR